HLLAAGADGDLVRLVVEAVLALELGADRVLERRRAVDIGVLGVARVDRALRRRLDVVGRVKVRLALRQADDVAALRRELAGLHRDADGRRGLDARQPRSENGHGVPRRYGGKARAT